MRLTALTPLAVGVPAVLSGALATWCLAVLVGVSVLLTATQVIGTQIIRLRASARITRSQDALRVLPNDEDCRSSCSSPPVSLRSEVVVGLRVSVCWANGIRVLTARRVTLKPTGMGTYVRLHWLWQETLIAPRGGERPANPRVMWQRKHLRDTYPDGLLLGRGLGEAACGKACHGCSLHVLPRRPDLGRVAVRGMDGPHWDCTG
jgi:hypothetical protein